MHSIVLQVNDMKEFLVGYAYPGTQLQKTERRVFAYSRSDAWARVVQEEKNRGFTIVQTKLQEL